MLKKFIIIILIDILIVALWDYWASSIHVEQEESLGVIFIVPVLIIISGIAGLFLKFRKSLWANVLLTNVVIAFAIFIAFFKLESWKQQHNNYLTYYFTDNDKVYNVTLKLNNAELRNGLTYNIYERLGEYGNAATDLDGNYAKKNDTLILTSDKGKVMKIFGNNLFDYPKKGDLVELRNEPD